MKHFQESGTISLTFGCVEVKAGRCLANNFRICKHFAVILGQIALWVHFANHCANAGIVQDGKQISTAQFSALQTDQGKDTKSLPDTIGHLMRVLPKEWLLLHECPDGLKHTGIPWFDDDGQLHFLARDAFDHSPARPHLVGKIVSPTQSTSPMVKQADLAKRQGDSVLNSNESAKNEVQATVIPSIPSKSPTEFGMIETRKLDANPASKESDLGVNQFPVQNRVANRVESSSKGDVYALNIGVPALQAMTRGDPPTLLAAVVGAAALILSTIIKGLFSVWRARINLTSKRFD